MTVRVRACYMIHFRFHQDEDTVTVCVCVCALAGGVKSARSAL